MYPFVSEDGGQTWTRRALNLSAGTQAMPFVDARDDGAHADGMPGEVDADWHVHFARLPDPVSPNGTVDTWRVSDTVHHGSVCVKGPACGPDEDRALLDHPWVELGPEGDRHLAFASTQAEDVSAFPISARVNGAGG
jgi:hypothetical protein